MKVLLWASGETFGSMSNAHSTTSFLLYQLCGMIDMVNFPERWPSQERLLQFQDHYNLFSYNEYIEEFKMRNANTYLNSCRKNLFLDYWLRKEKLFSRWLRAPERIQNEMPYELFSLSEVFQLVDVTEVFFDTFPFFCSQVRIILPS